MKNSEKVSIVLPTYNGAKYIRQSIDSCLNQTYKNIELIIVDDGSTDHTPNIIKKYLKFDRRIHSARHDWNRKLPAALNTGFDRAKGDYFTWISDDNCYRPNAIEYMLNCLLKHPDIGIVYTDYVKINDRNDQIEYVKVPPPDKLACGNAVRASFLYRRKVHEALNGYNEDLFLVEDYDFWLRASLLFKLKPLHQDLYVFKVHNSSLTNTQAEIVRKMHEDLLSRYLPRMDWINKYSRALGYINLANVASKRSDVRKTFYYLFQAIIKSQSFHILKAATEITASSIMSGKMFNFVSISYKCLKKIIT